MILALLLASHVTCTEVSMWRTVCVIEHKPRSTPYWTPPVILDSDRKEEPEFRSWPYPGHTMHADCYSWDRRPECAGVIGNWHRPCVNLSGEEEHCEEPKATKP